MNFKRVFLYVGLFLALSTALFAQEKWNILIANSQDFSAVKDENIGVILRKSIKSQLEKEKRFNSTLLEDSAMAIENRDDALEQGRTNKADVIIYGQYYIEEEKLIVFVEILDVLHDRIKLRKYYTGEVTLDIFDTIDEIIVDLIANIKEVLPEITADSEIEIKKIRKVLYEQEDVKLKRTFYTSFGALGEFGHKKIYYYDSEKGMDINTFDDTFPSVTMYMSYAIRLRDIRVDFTIAGLPGFPVGLVKDKEYNVDSYDNFPPVFLCLSYYLPFWDKKLALGFGMNSFEFPTKYDINTDNGETNWHFDGDSLGVLGLSLRFIFNPSERWEFALGVNFVPQYQWEKDNGDETNWTRLVAEVPAINLSTTFFINDLLGIEARFMYSKIDFEYKDNILQNYFNKHGTAETICMHLGLVYRVDFGK